MKEIIYCNKGKLRNPCVDVVVTLGDVIRVRRIRKKITHSSVFREKYPEALDVMYTQQYSLIAGILNQLIDTWGYDEQLPATATVIYKGFCYYNVFNHTRNTYMDMVEARHYSSRHGEAFSYIRDRALVGFLVYHKSTEQYTIELSQPVVDSKLDPIDYKLYRNNELIIAGFYQPEDGIASLETSIAAPELDSITDLTDNFRLSINGTESAYTWDIQRGELMLNLPLMGG